MAFLKTTITLILAITAAIYALFLGTRLGSGVLNGGVSPHIDDYVYFQTPFSSDTDEYVQSNVSARQANGGRDCGVFRMNCENAWDVCNNACFYHYCVRGGGVYYYSLGTGTSSKKTQNDWNRARSGQNTNNGGLCYSLPISQKFFDIHGRWAEDKFKLDADEWPMADMLQGDLDPHGIMPRNSLRCALPKPNYSGGSQLRAFTEGAGRWSKKPQSKPSSTGSWLGQGQSGNGERTCDGPLQHGDRFKVIFDPARLSADQQATLVPYCTKNSGNAVQYCNNDGKQFHLTSYRPGDGNTNGNGAGSMGWPYDAATLNTYAMTDYGQLQQKVRQSYNINMLQVVVVRSGLNGQDFDVTVSKYYNKAYVRITNSKAKVNPGQHMDLDRRGDLLQRLRVSRRNSGCELDFWYGEDSNKGNARSTFFSSDAYGAASKKFWKNRKVFSAGGEYCLRSSKGTGATMMMRYECWFAAF